MWQVYRGRSRVAQLWYASNDDGQDASRGRVTSTAACGATSVHVSSLCRPKTNADDEQYGEGSGPGVDTAKFKPDKGFEGAEGGAARAKGGRVEFENEAADPFGIDSFLTDGKK